MANRNFYKRNYVDALQITLPGIYQTEDLQLSGLESNPLDIIINSHIHFCDNVNSILSISATDNFSDIQDFSGISRFLIKQNNLTDITAEKFDRNILKPLGVRLTDFDSSSTFKTFVSSNLLPKITLNSSSLHIDTVSAYAADASSTHEFLINELSWLYFLNTSGVAFSPSSYVIDAMTEKLYFGKTIKTVDGIKGLENYLWRDYATLSSVHVELVPSQYREGATEFTSGTQALDNILTLIDVIYSPLWTDRNDVKVAEALQDFIDVGDLLTGEVPRGPWYRFLQAVGFAVFDTLDQTEELTTLQSIESCPPQFLPYLSDLIGWKLYGKNADAWRRQLLTAVTLYKKKGTKEGLAGALDTILINNPIDEDRDITELFESYIPFLMYYLLKTDTLMFDSFESWSFNKAENLTNSEYSYDDMDLNIRYVIDNILLRAVKLFPELFRIKNFQFDLTNPEFVFKYRDRIACIPPWEEEKFYRNCDISNPLITFFKQELDCLGVTPSSTQSFKNYILSNTVSGDIPGNHYGNAFLFFTDTLQLPPNYQTIIQTYDKDSYDFLSLWNGKSSHFDLTVSAGTFNTEFFQNQFFDKQDLFDSLQIVDEFIPAKAIARTNIRITDTDNVSAIEQVCPKVSYALIEVQTSGAIAGFQTSSVHLGDPSLGLRFGDKYPGADNDRFFVDHTGRLAFLRRDVDQLSDDAITTTVQTEQQRTSHRRRNYQNVIAKSGWYTRDGYNGPSFYNTSSQGQANTEYAPLGLVAIRGREFEPVTDVHDLQNPWRACDDLDSPDSFQSIDTSNTFPIREHNSLSISSCHSYNVRDRLPEMNRFIFNLIERKRRLEAQNNIRINSSIYDSSSFWIDIETSIANIIQIEEVSLVPYMDAVLGKRLFSRTSLDGMQKIYHDYINHYSKHSTGENQLLTERDGGATVISHTFGPIYYNASFEIDGSAITTSSQLLSTTIDNEESFLVEDTTGAGAVLVTDSIDLPIQRSEYRNPHIISGVELVDTFDTTNSPNEISYLKVDVTSERLDSENFLVDNPVLLLKSKRNLARIRFNLKDYGPTTNVLIPEHDFELNIHSVLLDTEKFTKGGGVLGAWVHTSPEVDHHGNRVFWNYMPNGKWEMLPVEVVTGSDGFKKVKDELAHTFSHLDVEPIKDQEESCFRSTENVKNILFAITKDTLDWDKLVFDTRNLKIDVPLAYYQQLGQVHRADQNYIVEVFYYPNSQEETFLLLDNISMVDIRQRNRAKIKHEFTIPDFSPGFIPTTDNFKFFSEDGVHLSAGTFMEVDLSGNVTQLGSPVTVGINPQGDQISKFWLYSQVSAIVPEKWISSTIRVPKIQFDGIFTHVSGSLFSPSSLELTGLNLGTHIKRSITDFIILTPKDVLTIIRYFNLLSEGLASRDSNISEGNFGARGGSRLNYRQHPQNVGTFSDQYTTIDVIN